MSKMSYREPNQVLWRGVRPAHLGAQVAASITIANGTAVIHTVTAGKTLFLNVCSISSIRNVNGRGSLFVTNAGDVTQYTIAIADGMLPSGSIGQVVPFSVPLEIPADYKVKITSQAVGQTVFGFIHGWEE